MLTAFAREHAILIDHTTASLRPELPEYNLEIDYDTLLKAFKLTRKEPNEEGKREVIHPTPWDNAPATDGDTTEFTKALRECTEYMEHFATHTPSYFLHPTIRHKSETRGKARRKVKVGGQGKKRDVPEPSGDEGRRPRLRCWN